MKNQNRTIYLKLIVIGDGACGKTCLLTVFGKGSFPEVYVPTVFESYVAQMEVDGKNIGLALWDTVGQEEYDHLRPLSYPSTDVILMCYSVDTPESFGNIKLKWVPEVNEFCPNVPIVLVGNKTDLRSDELTLSQLRKANQEPVSMEDGIKLADDIHAFVYMECSAKTMKGVSDVFDEAVRAAVARKPKKKTCTLL